MKPEHLRAAALTTIGQALDIPQRPGWLVGLTAAPSTVLDKIAELGPDPINRTAIVLLSSAVAMRRAGLRDPRADRDARDAGECVFAAFFVANGGVKQPAQYTRDFLRLREAELAVEAERLVTEHWAEIQAEAERRANNPDPDANGDDRTPAA
jgi:hypothetical protein